MQLDVFQTLADPTRRRIVEALRDGEQQVADVVEKAGIHQSGVSRHLRILYESGFVAMRPDGQRRLYALKPEPFREIDEWLGQYRKLWEARLDRFESALNERQQVSRRAKERSKEEMSAQTSRSDAKIVIERTYRADIEDVWALWTTKEGFESWWGPQGFRAEIQELDARVGGALRYEMIADSPEMIAVMKQMGQPTSHATRSRFTEVKAHSRLVLTNVIDFLPGVATYESNIAVDFTSVGDSVRMVVALDAMHSEEFTKMQKDGFTSQLTKLDNRFA